jgi:peptidoglycan/xylan/chitin deacetylase (PgdA/CDA1 family)
VTPHDPWVCLMYHDVSTMAPALTGGGAYFSVSKGAFERHLEIIEGLGLHGCSIEEAIKSDAYGRVAISFDDGDLGQAVRAFPALAARRMTATFFITTGWIGRPAYVSWDHLREMRAAGMSIQAHTHSHPFLSELSLDAVRDELRRPRDLLDEHLTQQTTSIALPGGDAPRPHMSHLFAAEGYSVVATSRWGLNPAADEGIPRYIRRCTIRGESDDLSFAAIVRGDRWVGVKRRAREGTLAFVRSSLGPTRYARWRRALFNAAGSASS